MGPVKKPHGKNSRRLVGPYERGVGPRKNPHGNHVPIQIPPPTPRAPATVSVIPRRNQIQRTPQSLTPDHVVADVSVAAAHADSTPARAPAGSMLTSRTDATAACKQSERGREVESSDHPSNANATPLSAKQTKKVRFIELENESMDTNQEMEKSVPNNAHNKQIGAIEIDFGGGNVAPQIQVQKPTQDEGLLDPTKLQQQMRGLTDSDKKGRNLEFGAPDQTDGVQQLTFLDMKTGVCVTQKDLPTLKNQTGPKREQKPLNLVQLPIKTNYLPETTARFWAKKRTRYNASSIGSEGRMQMQALEDQHGDMVPDPPPLYTVGVDANAVVVQSQERNERDGKKQAAQFSLDACDSAKLRRTNEKRREKNEEAANKARYADLASIDYD